MSDCNHAQWQPPHDYRPLERRSERRTWAVVILTGLTMLLEIVAGYWFNSMALLADGWHMASHMVAIGLAALAYLLARRYAADHRFAFGTWKIEVLAGFASALLLVVVALFMIGESLLRFWAPAAIGFDEALVVAVVGLLVNLLSAWLLRDQHDHGHGHGHGDDAHSHAERGHAHAHGAPGKDLNRHAAFIHVLTDALTSVAAIIALLGGKLFGWGWLDPAMGIIGALVILVWARGLLRDTAKALLDREMDDPLVGKVREALERVPDTEVTDLHLWRVGRSQYSCILSVVTHQPHTADRYKAALQPFAQLVHITAEVNRCGESAHLDSRQ
ncbi:CDF family Co(II)/Ni(II) efflux transporter DmeF [Stutzerimonas stutzeri]|jgi:cation diffusion facilitator family transporter|uniref:CDF family Co(II)/Ni(II) efflux transporter DmeF n=1 Tax=Stutzerimonas stutzeri TaxID=316 RepID=UPI00020470EA|nr:CDF family Co(II)/Ni(II) efflux transporter DmeF [Stutzerimonas stutzeri]NMY63043.1 CDF family Co(II)/Ni(II) efflux transporter DmeF [Pseudomonas sp. WS 5018]AEA83040.1 metal transporter [Stutzerimonas stutzeri DSM 4166]MDH0102871.1 CDF family Co(II)/Ni(II) efflux transporter DmeF [Stutzerimonas stutzeri]MDH0155551.1 CDF family Co(II)/Ni(II) efflux transporter DmeF [Stutzerimonas stutzeri]MDH0445347.1 CDF family Co(II)/Ni(II) efflux transporter DmeF [Stutzerimonas stutzeri]